MPNPVDAVAGLKLLSDVVQDSVAVDSVVVESPLPGGAATVARFLLQVVPRWLQIAGVVIGCLAAVALLFVVWKKRSQIVAWLASRSTQVKIAIGAAVTLLLLGAGTAGTVSWRYMQHNNGFCTGCHVMEPAFFRFEQSEHDSLSCHDCHQQSILASTRQLYLWVAERPDEIGEHAPVSNSVCEKCHVTGEPEVWQRIASTAGHRTHLESDSVHVMCVTCHGVEVHRFAPVDQTCGQSGCHESSDTKIAIGGMEQQTSLHCITCHQFTAEVPALATRDSAAATLIPDFDKCTSCHEMQEILADFDPAVDPHQGRCGSCHHPHEQDRAQDAATTCASSDCHSDWRNEPFHTGSAHRDVGSQCTLCHVPHRARLDASDCVGCHNAVSERSDVPNSIRQRLRRAAPFDTTAVLRRTIGAARPPRVTNSPIRSPPALGFWGVGLSAIPPLVPSLFSSQNPVALPDSFSHDQHEDLTCLTCHTPQTEIGPLRFERPRGCRICHHQAPQENGCSSCHASDQLSASLHATISVTVADAPTRVREVGFRHDLHESVGCTSCHTVAVTLAPTEAVQTCTDCHMDHHAAGRSCVQCHDNQEPTAVAVHAPPNESHVGCADCHDVQTVRELFPDEQFCGTCHELGSDHPASSGRTCTECHFLVPPDLFRRHLVGTRRSS